MSKLDSVIAEWVGTPFIAGSCRKRIGADCTSFLYGVLSELHTGVVGKLHVSKNAGLAEAASAVRVVADLLREFPSEKVLSTAPGCIIVCASKPGGLVPAHSAIVESSGIRAWHCCANAGVRAVPVKYLLRFAVALYLPQRSSEWI